MKLDATAKPQVKMGFQMLIRARAGQTQRRVQAKFGDMLDVVVGFANML